MKLTRSLIPALLLFIGTAQASTYLYVSSNSPRGDTTLNELNPTTGELMGSPLFVGEDSFFQGASDFAIHQSYFYATNSRGTAKCILMPDKSVRQCEHTGSGFSYPAAIRFHEDSRNHTLYAYVANKPYKTTKSSISKCVVNVTDGALSNCESTGSLFDIPISIAFYDNDYAYIANFGGKKSIIRCKMTSSGEFVSCSAMVNTEIVQPRSIAINNQHAYIADGDQDSVILCAINNKTGSFENCKSTGHGFSYPSALLIYQERLYVTNQNDNTISSCKIQSQSGLLDDCVKSVYDSTAPYRMIIYDAP